ncbi:hypothetical protein LDENG_00029580 [Lucifuga dentata]|nr:hypothetical protein LDENG_00029580 [Lucifuga dentata]
MERSTGTVCAIKALGYPSSRCLTWCECDELPCPMLTWLRGQLRAVCPHIYGSDRMGDVLLVEELRSLLSNISSPLTLLTSETLEPSLLNKVTEFIVSELQAAYMIKYKELHPEDVTRGEESAKEQRIADHSNEHSGFCQESDEDCDGISDENKRKMEMHAEWKLLLEALNMDASSQFTDVVHEVESKLPLLPHREMPEPLLHSSLSSEQWAQAEKINQALSKDYQCRRQMMIKRFQVTLESFAWGEKEKEHREALALVPPLTSLTCSSRVSLPLLLAARQDQSYIEPIRARLTRTPVYKVLMGSVPDRGGRPGEIEPPMPAWGDRRTKGNRSGCGSGHH